MQGKYKQLVRVIEKKLYKAISAGQSVLLLGPRQVGKTTLVKKLLINAGNTAEYYLQDPTTRIALEADPGSIIRQIEAHSGVPVVFVDEAQKVPELFDAAQYLIDNTAATFILSGSSARKLRRKNANLLPGRIQKFSLDPLLWSECGLTTKSRLSELAITNVNEKVGYTFTESMVFGSLPAVVSLDEKLRADYLRSYTEIYLEEEIRAEAIVRKVGAFSRFLELAAHESGTSPNLTKLSNESGVSAPSIKEFYRILEDTLVVERVEPFLRNARKRILASPRYYFFDTGVRNALARMPVSQDLMYTQKGTLFEHAVVLEIRRRVRALGLPYQTYYWRTAGGAEVDCVLDLGDEIIPIEIKSAKSVMASDLKGLASFINEYSPLVKRAYVVTMDGEAEKLTDVIMRIPWHEL